MKAFMLVLALLLAAVASVGYFFVRSHQEVEAAQRFQLDSRVTALSDPIGINRDNLITAQAQVTDDATICNTNTSDSQGHNAYACYDPIGMTIYLPTSLFSNDVPRQLSALAHEYLHWVWATKVADKPKLCSSLMVYYNTNTQMGAALRHRLAPYNSLGVGSIAFCNELHSFVGTEVSGSELAPADLNYYKLWLPKREALPSYY